MKKWWRSLLMTVLALSCLSLCGCSAIENAKDYKEAEKLLKQGEYMEAVDLYFDLYAVFEYKDSEEEYKMCYYEYGKQLIQAEDWIAARVQFDKIDDYKDAQDYISQCEANLAYEQLFSELKGYELLMSDLQLDSFEKVSLGGSKYGELFTTGAHFKSEEFGSFTDNDKLTVFEVISEGLLLASRCTVISGDAVYTYSGGGPESTLYKDGEKILVRRYVDSPTCKTLTSGDSCLVCNGSGSVKYNYGSSDLEAILSGHDPYTVGECTSCDGKGKYYKTTKRDDVPKTDAQKMKDGTYETEEQAYQRMFQELIDGFGSASGSWDAGSGPYSDKNRKAYERLDASTIMDALVGEWTMKDDWANTRTVIFHNDYTVTYIDADGNEIPLTWEFEKRFASDISLYRNNTYEVRKVTENLLAFYNSTNRLHFILYR